MFANWDWMIESNFIIINYALSDTNFSSSQPKKKNHCFHSLSHLIDSDKLTYTHTHSLDFLPSSTSNFCCVCAHFHLAHGLLLSMSSCLTMLAQSLIRSLFWLTSMHSEKEAKKSVKRLKSVCNCSESHRAMCEDKEIEQRTKRFSFVQFE